jgi:hypothetical protein
VIQHLVPIAPKQIKAGSGAKKMVYDIDTMLAQLDCLYGVVPRMGGINFSV